MIYWIKRLLYLLKGKSSFTLLNNGLSLHNTCQIDAFKIVFPYSRYDDLIKFMSGLGWSPDSPGDHNTNGRWVVLSGLYGYTITEIGIGSLRTIRDAHIFFTKGSYLIASSDHVCACIDGIIYDTIDLRSKKLWKIWEVTKNNT